MRSLQTILKSLLLAATIAQTATALPANLTEPDGTDVAAGWTFQFYKDGLCKTQIQSDEGSTSEPCDAVQGQANSYSVISSTDPQTGVSFALNLYSSLSCQNTIITDNGKAGTCNTVLFESWNIVFT
ncbi:hypothetical protein F5B22DRAFT_649521 [Xylaria bambusicola]|uniref:uncharacterized protein n=1 Tax=Xylaria bambusicola TaxID=326684 RepID=UPI002007B8EA|nr:uncharacterized protein F5B22DRAFT_649521 [Xylaria bambusicola]KAI0509024.1 hypothetical protein F5B22DRAFT_649521 [Xylaria bambusicola]